MMTATVTLSGVATGGAKNAAARNANDGDDAGFATVLAGSVHGPDQRDDQPVDRDGAQQNAAGDTAEQAGGSPNTQTEPGKAEGAHAKHADAKHVRPKQAKQAHHDPHGEGPEATIAAQQSVAFIEGAVALTASTTPGGSVSISSAATTSAAISSAVDAVSALTHRAGQLFSPAKPTDTKVASGKVASGKVGLVDEATRSSEAAGTAEGAAENMAKLVGASNAVTATKINLTDLAGGAAVAAPTHGQAHSSTTRATSSGAAGKATGAGKDGAAVTPGRTNEIPDAAVVAAGARHERVAVPAAPSTAQAAGTTVGAASVDMAAVSPTAGKASTAAQPPAVSTAFADQLAGAGPAVDAATPREHTSTASSAQAKTGPSVAAADPSTLASSIPVPQPLPTTTTQQVGAPVAAPQALPTPQNSAEAASQVANTLIADRKLINGEHQITVNLHPAELGAVRVIAHVMDGQIRVELDAAHDAGHEALRAGLGELDKTLKDNGFTGVNVSLAHSDAREQQRPFSPNGNDAETDGRRAQNSTTNNSRQMDNPPVRPIRTISSRTSLDRWL